MKKRYFNTRLTNSIVNLTDEAISLYEETSGKIKTFHPAKEEMPGKSVFFENGAPAFYYVVNQEKLDEIKQSCRRLDDVAVIDHFSVGRNNRAIVYLNWAKCPKVKIRLHNDAHKYACA